MLAALAVFLAAGPARPGFGAAVEIQFTTETFQRLYAPFGLCDTEAGALPHLRFPVSVGPLAEGMALAGAGQYTAAVSSLEAAYDQRPRPSTAVMIGNLYYHLGDSAAALRWWQRHRQATVDMFLNIAHACHIADAHSKDNAYLEAAARILPPNHENWRSYKPLVRIAQIRFNQGHYDEAIALYREVVEHVHPELRDGYRDRLAQTCRRVLEAAPHNTAAKQCLTALEEATNP